jgi:hypothetical protein
MCESLGTQPSDVARDRRLIGLGDGLFGQNGRSKGLDSLSEKRA